MALEICHQRIGVGNQLLHWKYQDHSNCPMCGADNKKVSHVLTCPDVQATSFALERIDHHLTENLDTTNTSPVLKTALMAILQNWRKGIPIRPLDFHPAVLQQ